MPLPPLSPLNDRFSGARASAWEVADRAHAMAEAGRDIIHLSIGDPDLDTPAPIRAAAIAAIDRGRTHYSAVPGEPALRRAVAAHASDLYGRAVGAEQVVITPGAQPALFSAFTCIAGPGREVILLEPSYATYEGAAAAGGARVVPVALDAARGFALDLEAVRAAITPHTAALLLNSPGNPAGRVFTAAEVRALLDLARAHGFWLVSDEVYYSYVFEGVHASPFAMPGAEDHVIVVNSVSKSFAMTGWRVGWVIAPPPVAAAIANLSQCSIFGVAQFSQDAVVVSLERTGDAPDAFREIFRRRRDVLCDALAQLPGMRVQRPAGGMFLMADIAATGLRSGAFADALLDEAGVAVVPGYAFGAGFDGFVRLGFLQDEALLREAGARIAGFMARFAAEG